MEPENTSVDSTATSSVHNPFIIPGAILIGFAMIAAAIYFSGGFSGHTKQTMQEDTSAVTQEDASGSSIRPVDENDHIRGNPNAPIVIVEYSDYDCPFCKKFHETMKAVMAEYGTTGKVAWVYRHFPIEQIHPNAAGIALAAECVADLGGNDAFWTFSDLVFEDRLETAQTNMAKVPDYAVQAGVDKDEFNACVREGRFVKDVQEDYADGVAAGVTGTPYSLVLVGGQQGIINGAQPYEMVKQIIDTLLLQIGDSSVQ